MVEPEHWEQRLPAALRRLRLRQELSQEDAAAQAGLSVVTLSKWERGLASPQFGLLARLLSALGADWAVLQATMEEVPLEQEARRPLPVVHSRPSHGPPGPPEPEAGSPIRQGGLVVWWAAEEIGGGGEELEAALVKLRQAVQRQIYRRHRETGPERRDPGDADAARRR